MKILDRISDCIGKTISDIKTSDDPYRDLAVIFFSDETAIVIEATAGYEEGSLIIRDTIPEDIS